MWVPAGIGFVGAVIGAGAALLGQWLNHRLQMRSAAAFEHRSAVEEVLVCSQAVDLRAHELVLLAANLGSLSGLVARAVGSLAPVDLLAVFGRVDAAADELQRAAARVWLFADPRTVALTNTVVLAAMDVVDAHHQPARGRAWSLAKVAVSGQLGVDATRVTAAREELASARRALIGHARQTLRLTEVDPFEGVVGPSTSRQAST